MGSMDKLNRITEAFSDTGIGLTSGVFGTDHASLSSISRFPMETLKADHSLAIQMTSNPKNTTIVLAVIALALGMVLKIIAENARVIGRKNFVSHIPCPLQIFSTDGRGQYL